MRSLVNKIWAKEGLYGFGKGFSACFYGAVFSGFLNFAIYKGLKGVFRDNFGSNMDIAFCYMLAGSTAQAMTLLVQYPYDLIKCRLQSVNYIFKYQNLPHAFRKEVKKQGLGSLYQGSSAFLLTYSVFQALQFTVYEKTMSYFKSTLDAETLARRKTPVNCLAGLLAGSIAAGLTNSLEAITVAKQTSPSTNILELVKRENVSLLTKGLLPRIYYNGLQSLILFSLLD